MNDMNSDSHARVRVKLSSLVMTGTSSCEHNFPVIDGLKSQHCTIYCTVLCLDAFNISWGCALVTTRGKQLFTTQINSLIKSGQLHISML